MLNRHAGWLIAAAALLTAMLSEPAISQSLADAGALNVPAPKGAIVLLDGRDLSQWVSRKDGQPAGWTRGDGWVEVKPGNGDILTRQRFQDYRLHVEFWLPYMPEATGQARAHREVYSGLPPENNDYSQPGPILFQDHGNKVRYRNIWIVPG